MERLTALQARSRRALRELADRAKGERVAIQGLAAGVTSHLRALPEVAVAAVGAVQVGSICSGELFLSEGYANRNLELKVAVEIPSRCLCGPGSCCVYRG